MMNDDVKKQSAGSRLREWQREHTQTAILTAAEAVLAEEGLAARIDAIAQRAGVAVGTLYNHFGDRDALVQAALDHNRATLLAAMDAVLATPSPDFDTDLKRFVSALADHWRQHGAFLTAVLTEHCRSEVFASKRSLLKTEMHDKARGLIARGVACGRVRAGHDDLFAEYLLGLVRIHVVQQAMLGLPIPDLNPTIDLFLHGAVPRT